MAAKDFTANQIRTAKLILTGGIGVGNLGLSVYSGSLASDNTGTSSDSNMYAEVGGDVTVFISGSGLTRGNPSATGGTLLVGGDIAVSGTIYASGSHRHNPFGTISGSIHRTRDGLSYLVAGAGMTISSGANGQVTFATSAGADQNLFSTVAVTAGSGSASGGPVVADATTDTLTFRAGRNITLTAEAGEDRITIDGAPHDFEYYDEFDGSPIQPPGASGSHSVVIGDGSRATLQATGSIILGTRNTGSAEYGAIGGGSHHLISSASNYGTIAGGYNNIITSSAGVPARADYATIGGGTSNKISATAQGLGTDEAVIAGGDRNFVFGSPASMILGGTANYTNMKDSVALVGQFLTASQHHQVILGFGEEFAGQGDLAVIASGTFFKSAGANGGAISGSIFHTKDGLSYLQAGSNVTITSGTNGQITIAAASGGSSEWTDGGNFLRPSDSSGAEHVVIGGTSLAAADILLKADGGADFNAQANDTDFRVASKNRPYALFVSGTDDQVLILSGGSSPGSVDEAKGRDVAFYVSGSAFSKSTPYRGTSLFGGDIVSSGTIGARFGLSGSLTKLANGSSYIEAGANITVTSASNGPVIISSTAGGMTGFFLEDNDGTEVNINDSNEVKFVEGTGIDINWTDTSTGDDGDPYDMTFTVTGSSTAVLYSAMGPHMIVSGAYGAEPAQNGVVGMKDDVSEAAISGYSSFPNGPVVAFPHTLAKPPAMAFRLNVPENASTVRFEVYAKNNVGGQSGVVQFVVAGRLHPHAEPLDARNNAATSGYWVRDNVGADGWQDLTANPWDAAASTTNQLLTGSTFNITDLVNAADQSKVIGGSVIDIAIARNRTGDNSADFGTTKDTFGNVAFVTHVKAVFGF